MMFTIGVVKATDGEKEIHNAVEFESTGRSDQLGSCYKHTILI